MKLLGIKGNRLSVHSRATLCFCFAFLVLLLTLPTKGLGQSLASIAGTVTDITGAAIPGARIQLKSATTGAVYQTKANGEGFYILHYVKPGSRYVLTVSHAGFESEKITGIYMNVASTRTQNSMLQVGHSVQTVEVSASNENETLDTTDATLGNNFSGAFLQSLPVENRDSPAVLLALQPGITSDGATTGSRDDQDRITIDGLDVNDMATGNFGSIVANAPVDSVEQFRGVVAGEQANAISGGGGHFELVTKNGTNEFHGDLNEYHRDTALTANSWFNNNANVPRSPLVRNQFGGSLGGPILRNRLFFYFDYNGRRDTLSNQVEQTVPLDSYRNGNINYENASGGISTLSPAQVAALDPEQIGFDPALLSLFSSRYPHANDLAYGDQINTGGFRFNAPFPYKENDYVGRIDWTVNSKMKLFAVTHVTRTTATQSAVQFPGDPMTSPFIDDSYSWVIGDTWTLTPNMVNQAYLGETYEDWSFPNTYNPTGVNQFQSMGPITPPYASAINAQGRTYPIPVVRDELSYIHGNHSYMFGGYFKWPSPNSWQILNYNSPTVGLGGNISQLNASLRPADLNSGSAQQGLYDSAFAFALGAYSSISAEYNYNAQGKVLPQGSGQSTKYKYYEWDLYAGDTWKVASHLTLNYGLHWDVYTDPYEVHGIEAIPNYGFDKYFYNRVAQSEAGVSGNLALPFIQYTLGGKANHAPGDYATSYNNVAPNLGFAWNPASMSSTVFNGSAGIIYDQSVVNAIDYFEYQSSYLFLGTNVNNMGIVGDPYDSLAEVQRFTTFNAPPPPPAPSVISNPYVPYVTGSGENAVPSGLGLDELNSAVDPNLKTPYSITYNFGIEQSFPKGFILKMSYAGRLGRRLLAQVDASQLVDFPDKQSGQMMSQAIANLEKYARNNPTGTTPPVQPWFEDLLQPIAMTNQANGTSYANNTQYVLGSFGNYVANGDFGDIIQQLAAAGVLPANVGMASQFADNTYFTNKGFSAYNGMLVTLHKNMGNGLQFDLNYTWSHSIDNVSAVANTGPGGGTGAICDVMRLGECRANSDFDVTNYLSGNFVYQLPFGRGEAIAGNVPYWLNEIIGGWTLSGLPSWHTGNVYNIKASAYVAGFSNQAAAVLVGNLSDLKIHIHGGNGQPLYAYSNTNKAQSDYTGPVGFEVGSRNNLRGPGYFNFDFGLAKSFPIYRNRVHMDFRADAFNALNHPNFDIPNNSLTASSQSFGQITSTNDPITGNANPPRQLQVALRLEF